MLCFEKMTFIKIKI